MGDSCPRVGIQRACDDELMRDVYHGMLHLETGKGSDIIAGVLKEDLGDAGLGTRTSSCEISLAYSKFASMKAFYL